MDAVDNFTQPKTAAVAAFESGKIFYWRIDFQSKVNYFSKHAISAFVWSRYIRLSQFLPTIFRFGY